MVAMFALAAVLPACGGSGASGDSKVSITMGNDSTPDEAYLPLTMAMKKLAKTYDVKKDIQFSGTDLALQALSQNKIQFMSVPVPQAASALGKLPGIRVVGTRSNNQWTFLAKSAINNCKQLDGKNVGLFSTKGVSTAYVDLYFNEQCPGVKPHTIITADSTLRRQSLVAGRLDATPLQATDAVQVLAKDSSKFHELTSFATELPDVGRDVVLTNQAMLKQHPDVVQAFLTAQLQAIRGLYANPQSAETQTKALLGNAIPANVKEVADYFISHKLFCANGGLDDANIADSLKTFGKAGFNPTDVSTSKLVDKTAMNKVLAKIGKSKATTC
ncbi:MAG: ABC transporter substrate-binding protein [Streptosporangiales bacterium]|nr:ABC transporter substrate-binding protein [Streptosporangiales bacterium]